MSSSTTAPQQERSRAPAGMEQKQAGTQNECKDATTGRWQEEGKRTRSGMQKERAVAQEHQGRNEGSHTRNAAGIKQGYGKNAANATWGKIHTARGAQHEISRAAQQELSKNHRVSSRKAGIR